MDTNMSLEQLGHEVVEFVRNHKAWTAPIVFALAFGESLAFLSFVLPAWAALVGIGVLIRAGEVNFVAVLVAGALGAALGDWLSYWIGTKCKRSIARVWPFSSHPDLLPRGEASIKKWGVLAIFIGRFSGPLRATVPILAGVLEMPFRSFQAANFVSAFIWVAILLTLGDVGATLSMWLWDVADRFWK
jgi:membrane protein DedA with SNARE-associated domain